MYTYTEMTYYEEVRLWFDGLSSLGVCVCVCVGVCVCVCVSE